MIRLVLRSLMGSFFHLNFINEAICIDLNHSSNLAVVNTMDYRNIAFLTHHAIQRVGNFLICFSCSSNTDLLLDLTVGVLISASRSSASATSRLLPRRASA